MSREYYEALGLYHEALAEKFARGGGGIKREVQCRIDDRIYVYLYEDGEHVQTQDVHIPDKWFKNWPSDETVRRHVHRYANIGSVPITTLDA